MFVGIDVGGDRLHAVGLAPTGEIASARLFILSETEELLEWAAGAEVIAIDSPSSWSTGRHIAETDLPPKFQPARCAELALRADPFRLAVPWVTPREPEAGWMQVGIETFRLLEGHDRRVIEVYPYACFRTVSTGPLPKKTSAWGVRDRAFLLRRLGVDDDRLELWSHDGLDACMAAVVARDVAAGTASAASHEGLACDDHSRIHLPHRPEGSFILPSRMERFTWHADDLVIVSYGTQVADE